MDQQSNLESDREVTNHLTSQTLSSDAVQENKEEYSDCQHSISNISDNCHEWQTDKKSEDSDIANNKCLNNCDKNMSLEADESKAQTAQKETRTNNNADNLSDEDDEFDSSSGDEYESADEGEVEIEEEQLKLEEEKLTEEEKILKKEQAQKYKEEGNKVFKETFYKEAIKYYSRALQNCPYSYFKERSIMYSNRAACKLHLEKYEEAIKDCSKAIELHPHYLKAVHRRAELYEKVEKLEEALTDYQRVVELDPSQQAARLACMRLPDQIKEKNEKMKEEMMGKLKDLGNMVLKPFGLSTNNFKMTQDPNTGGYSVNFQQNPES